MLEKYSPEAIDVANPTISVAFVEGVPCRHDSAHRRCTTPQTIIERLRRSCPVAGCHPTNAVLIVGFYPRFVSDETLLYVPKARPYKPRPQKVEKRKSVSRSVVGELFYGGKNVIVGDDVFG